MDANQLDEILQGNSDSQVTRELIASSSQPLTTIKTVDGDEVSHGGLRISKWNPVGDAYDLKACFVTHISPSTNTFKLKLSASGEVMHVHCKKKPKIFRLLRLANTYEQGCDLNVMTFKNTGTEKKRVEIVDIIDKKALGGQLMESIKKDCEEN